MEEKTNLTKIDFRKTLEDTGKAIEADSIKLIGKKEMVDEIMKYMDSENLVVYKEERKEETKADKE